MRTWLFNFGRNACAARSNARRRIQRRGGVACAGRWNGRIRVFSPQFSRSMLELYLNDARPDGNAQC
jgi:hypothetical protein